MKLSPELEAKLLAMPGVTVNGRPLEPAKPKLSDEWPTSEKEFMAQVIAFAEACGWLVYHTYNSQRSEEGFLDLVLLRDTALIVVELKLDKLQPTEAQDKWLKAFRAAGVPAYCWHPMDRELIETLLK